MQVYSKRGSPFYSECSVNHGIAGNTPSRAKPGMDKKVQGNETPSKPCHYLLWFSTLEMTKTGSRMS